MALSVPLKETPLKIPQLGSRPKILYVGVLLLENEGEEALPHKELGLSNLYAGGPSILYVLSLYVLSAPPHFKEGHWRRGICINCPKFSNLQPIFAHFL